MRIHIGHHFFGSGNIGDDWMLAGFLKQTALLADRPGISCCTPHDRGAMRRRFPEIDWLTLELETRRSAIASADVWLGLGDTPFQSSVGPWLLDHLVEELDLCEEFDKPAYLLGVGVESAASLQFSQSRRIVGRVRHIWARDDQSARLLRDAGAGTGQISNGGDLANLYFRSWPYETKSGKLPPALVINVEQEEQLKLDELLKFVRQSGLAGTRWIAQEIRSLATSEMFIWNLLTPEDQALFVLRQPDYAGGTTESFLDLYADLSALLSTRYHSGLAAAWLGVPLALYARSQKIEFLRQELDAAACASLRSSARLAEAIRAAEPIERSRLQALADKADRAVSEFFATAQHP